MSDAGKDQKKTQVIVLFFTHNSILNFNIVWQSCSVFSKKNILQPSTWKESQGKWKLYGFNLHIDLINSKSIPDIDCEANMATFTKIVRFSKCRIIMGKYGIVEK